MEIERKVVMWNERWKEFLCEKESRHGYQFVMGLNQHTRNVLRNISILNAYWVVNDKEMFKTLQSIGCKVDFHIILKNDEGGMEKIRGACNTDDGKVNMYIYNLYKRKEKIIVNRYFSEFQVWNLINDFHVWES